MPANLTIFQKVEKIKEAVGIREKGALIDIANRCARELGVPTERSTLMEIVDNCYAILFGDSAAGESTSSGSGFGEAMADLGNTLGEAMAGLGKKLLTPRELTTAGDLLNTLSPCEQHAECCSCMDPLYECEIVCFTSKGKRTCPHFMCKDCGDELLKTEHHRKGDGKYHCPLCRTVIDKTMPVPKASVDPDGWFKCIDVGGDGKLSRVDVMKVLVAQFPIDPVKLEEEMPKLWKKWDKDHSGFLSKKEVVGGEGSLLHMVTTQLLKEEYRHVPQGTPLRGNAASTPAASQGQVIQVLVPQGAVPGQEVEFSVGGQKVRITLPASARPGCAVMCRLPASATPAGIPVTRQNSHTLFRNDPRQWFGHFDSNHDGKLTKDEMLRALVKTIPSVTLNHAKELINSLGLLQDRTLGRESNSISLEHFLSIHEIIVASTGR